MTNPLADLLRSVVDRCIARSTAPATWDMTAAATALAAAKKARGTAGDPGVAWLAKRLTPKTALYGWQHGGPDMILQECLRAPQDTGLPAAAEVLLDAWRTPVLVPVFRTPTEWDKAKLKAERMPQDHVAALNLSADGTLALASGGRGVARYRLSDGALDAFWASGRSAAYGASLSRAGTLAAVVKSSRDGRLVRVREADGNPEVTPLGDVVSHALRRDGGALAVVCDRTFEGGISVREEPLPPDEVLELSVWELPEAGKPRRVLRRRMPERPMGYRPEVSFDARGRLYLDAPEGLERLTGDAWSVESRWPLPGVVSAIGHSPSGARLLVTVNDESYRSTHLLLDADTGRVEATWMAGGTFLDEDLMVDGRGFTVTVTRGATGELVARADLPHYVRALAAPGGRVVAAPSPGNDPGPVEVLELRRPHAQRS